MLLGPPLPAALEPGVGHRPFPLASLPLAPHPCLEPGAGRMVRPQKVLDLPNRLNSSQNSHQTYTQPALSTRPGLATQPVTVCCVTSIAVTEALASGQQPGLVLLCNRCDRRWHCSAVPLHVGLHCCAVTYAITLLRPYMGITLLRCYLQHYKLNYIVWQARLHVADGAAAEGLQSLAHLMARVQRAAAHTPPQGCTPLQTLRAHESDVS